MKLALLLLLLTASCLGIAQPSIERLIDQGRLAEARRALSSLRASSPASSQLDLFEAMILYREGRPADALRTLQPTVDGNTAPADSFKLAALCLVALGKSSEVGSYINEAVRRKPGDAMAHYYLGLHRLESRQFDQAAAAFRESIRLQPDYPDAYTMLGLAEEESGRDEEALSHYRKAVELNARLGLRRDAPYVYLARHLNARGRNEEAVPALESALQMNPQSAEAWLLAGKVRSELGQHEEALQGLSRAAELRPRDKRVRYQRMRVYQKMGRTEEARREKEIFDRMSETELSLWENSVMRQDGAK